MNKKTIEIKERKNAFLGKGFVYLLLLVVALTITLLPYLITSLFDVKIYFFLIGGAAFVILTMTFVLHIYSECKPSNAIVITENGITDYLNVGDYEIEWSNIASVKFLGNENSQYLGISLEDSDIVLDNIKEKFAEGIRYNIEDNLPEIIVDQSDVRISLKKLKNIITDRVKDARKLDEFVPEKPKNNPFTTEDVLRAFGKLDKIDVEDTNEVPEESLDMVTEISNDSNSPNNDNDDVASISNVLANLSKESEPSNDVISDFSEPNCDNVSEATDASVPDHIFFAAQQKEDVVDDATPELDTSLIFISTDSNSANDTAVNVSQTNEDVDGEIEDILSRAKSTKISEIGKILYEKDTPYSTSRTSSEKAASKKDEELIIDFTATSKNKANNKNSSFDASLDELISSALSKENK